MKGKIKKLTVIALATTMLLGSTLTAHAWTCHGGSCYNSLTKINYVGQCTSCRAPMYLYQCPYYEGNSLMHTRAAICDSGHYFF